MLQIARSLWFKVSVVAVALALLFFAIGGRLILAQAGTGADAVSNVHESATAPPNDPRRVADVRVAGNVKVPSEKVMRYLRTRVGNKLDRSLITEDTERLLENHLFKDVRAEAVETGNGFAVTFRVTEFTGTIEEVVYRNLYNVSKETLEEMMPFVRKGEPLDPAQNKRAARDIEYHLKNELGHYWASVTLEEGALPTDQRVVFNLSQGPVLLVGKIRFLGGDEFTDAGRLSSVIATRPSFFGMGGIFNEAQVDADVKKLEDFYHDNGYLYAKAARELAFTEDGSRVDVVFHIVAGARHRVDSVTLDYGPDGSRSGLPVEEMRQVLQTPTGEYYGKKMVDRDVSHLKKFLRDHDLAARVETDTFEAGPGLVSVQYTVVPDEKARFDPLSEELPSALKPRICWTDAHGNVELLSSKFNFLIPVLIVFGRGCEWYGTLEAMLTEAQTAWSERIQSTEEAVSILKESVDGARRGEAYAALKEPLQNGGTMERQDLFLKILVQAATDNPTLQNPAYQVHPDSLDPLVRLGAIRALGGYKDPRAAAALVDAYLGRLPFFPEMNGKIRMQIMLALEKNGWTVARDFLLARAATSLDAPEDNDQRLAAMRSLTRFRGGEVAPALLAVMEQSTKQIALRNRAYLSLKAVTGADLPQTETQCWRLLLWNQPLPESANTAQFVRRLRSLHEEDPLPAMCFIKDANSAEPTAQGWDTNAPVVTDSNTKEDHLPSPGDVQYPQPPVPPLPPPFPVVDLPSAEQQLFGPPVNSDAASQDHFSKVNEELSLAEENIKRLEAYIGYRGLKPKVDLDAVEHSPGQMNLTCVPDVQRSNPFEMKDGDAKPPVGLPPFPNVEPPTPSLPNDAGVQSAEEISNLPFPLRRLFRNTSCTRDADADVIAEIVIQGNKHVGTEKIMHYLLTCCGMQFDKTLLQQDVQRLLGTELFSAVDPKCTLIEGGVRVTFEVAEYPVVEEIRFEHAGRLSRDDLRELTRCSGLVKNMTPDPEANRKACDSVQAELVARGYRYAKVWLKQGGASDAQVVFGVDEGPLVHIRSINFTGNSAVSCEKLRSRVDDKMLLLECTGAYQAHQADELCRDLERLYQAKGYCEASVRHLAKFAATYDEVALTFQIKEGRHYRVKDWQIDDREGEVPAELKNVIKLRKGEFYDASLAHKDADAIRSSYRKLGKTVSVNVDLAHPDTGFVRVIYHVAEPSAQSRTVVQGNAATVTSFLRPRPATTEESVVQEVVYRNVQHVSQESLQNLTKLQKGTPLDPVANLFACKEIQEHLKNKGRYWAKVTLDEGNRMTDERVVFNVQEGPLVKIRSMTFSGNKNLADDVLKQQLESPRTCLGAMSIFSDTAVRGDVNKLEEFYRAQGFRDVKVSRELSFSKDRTEVLVDFHINEGEKVARDGKTIIDYCWGNVVVDNSTIVVEVVPEAIPGADKGGKGAQGGGFGTGR